MGRIAEQLKKALDSKADLKDALMEKGMWGEIEFESYAEWVRQMGASNKYYIYTLAGDDTMGSVEGSGEYESGTTVTIKAIPSTGCKFVSWKSARGIDYGSTNPLELVVDAADNITAIFQKSKAGSEDMSQDDEFLLNQFLNI